jgi:F420-dependent oxidoreductase-like protein
MAAKVRFGIQTGQDNVDWAHLRDFWQFLDRETSFHSVWTIDHFVPPGAGQDPNGPCLEGWTALAAAAAATERIRIGCLVTGVTFRHPAVLAKMAATVDHISNGRLEFGLGAAWHEGEHRVYGIPFPAVGERSARLEEAAELTRLLFTSEGPVDYEGRHYQLRQAPFSPRCVQRPHPPIFIGGGGEKRTLRTAARFGDAINVSGDVDAIKGKIDVLRRHCADAGRDPADITTSAFVPVMLIDDAERAEQLRARFAPMSGTTPERARETMLIGDGPHLRGVVERYAEAGVSYIIMMSRPPYKQELYRRISDEVVAPFA